MRKATDEDVKKIHKTIEHVLSDLLLLESMIIDEDTIQDADDNILYRLIGTARVYILNLQELYTQKTVNTKPNG